MSASYHRNIGCYDDAIEEYKEALKNTDNIDNKLYVICQISSILYLEKDYYNMRKILNEGKKIVDNTDENGDIISEFYNMYGLCYLKMGRIEEALKNLEYAKNIAEEVYGEESDLCFKCRLNILYVYFMAIVCYDYSYRYTVYLKLLSEVLKCESCCYRLQRAFGKRFRKILASGYNGDCFRGCARC